MQAFTHASAPIKPIKSIKLPKICLFKAFFDSGAKKKELKNNTGHASAKGMSRKKFRIENRVSKSERVVQHYACPDMLDHVFVVTSDMADYVAPTRGGW